MSIAREIYLISSIALILIICITVLYKYSLHFLLFKLLNPNEYRSDNNWVSFLLKSSYKLQGLDFIWFIIPFYFEINQLPSKASKLTSRLLLIRRYLIYLLITNPYSLYQRLFCWFYVKTMRWKMGKVASLHDLAGMCTLQK